MPSDRTANATGSVNQKTKQIYLYNEAEVQYQDMDIKSGVIIIDYGKDLKRLPKLSTLRVWPCSLNGLVGVDIGLTLVLLGS